MARGIEWRRAVDALDGFMVVGVFAAVVVAAHYLLPLEGEAAEWTLWVVTGGVIPLAVAWIARGRVPLLLRRALLLIAGAVICWYVIRAQRWVALPLGVAQAWLAARLRREPVRARDVVIAIAAWAALGALGRNAWEFYVETLADYLVRPSPAWIAGTILILVSVTASLALHGRPGAARARVGWRWLAVSAALAVIALESAHVDYLFDDTSIHHWGVFTGPAEAVRQGGWLLWDTPATYGFLSTLALVATPTHSVWDGLLLLNVLACTVSAGLLFWFLRDHMNSPLALLLSLAAVLWVPGVRVYDTGGGVLATPSAGPFRFIWCQVLLAIAALRPRRPIALVIGTLVWLAGSLWASESAFYCSATWLPAYVLFTWEQPRRAWIGWLALPPLLALAAVAAISGYYWMHLGHGPDWYAFIEASIAVRGGVVALTMDPLGAVAVLVLMAWAISVVAIVALRTAPEARRMATLCAAFGMLWAISSYFVGRSHAVNVTNLLPSCCLIAAVLLRERRTTAETGVRTAMTTLFAAVLMLAWHEPSGWWPQGPLAQRWALSVDARRPVMSKQQLELMRRAGIVPGTPLVFYDWDVLKAWPLEDGRRGPDMTWLPVTPFTELVPVPPARRGVYVARFVERTRTGGWLIDHPDSPLVDGGGPWFFAALRRHFAPGPQHQVGRWRATRYDYVER